MQLSLVVVFMFGCSYTYILIMHIYIYTGAQHNYSMFGQDGVIVVLNLKFVQGARSLPQHCAMHGNPQR